MGILASLFTGPILSAFVGKLIDGGTSIFHDYATVKITKEQLAEKLQEVVLSSFTEIETQYLKSITETYTAFIGAASKNDTMARGWAVVLYTELFVLFWHQFGVPLATYIGQLSDPKFHYPSSGATVDWAYALIALCLGAPAIASRIGPAAGWAADSIGKIVKR